jgi:hypothetical protein
MTEVVPGTLVRLNGPVGTYVGQTLISAQLSVGDVKKRVANSGDKWIRSLDPMLVVTTVANFNFAYVIGQYFIGWIECGDIDPI